jgi:putative ABC transport system permease protein
VRALDLKLARELWDMRLQALAIAMVIVSGVGVFIMSFSTVSSLLETRERYYRENRFADVFAPLKRAPEALARRVAAMPGADRVQTRVVAYVSLDITGFPEPVSAHLVSLPEQGVGRGAALLNRVHLHSGRLPEPGRNDEALVSVELARAHELVEGDTLRATINGRRERLTIVGLARSPEYIYQIAPGAMFPDPARYGILWMGREALGKAYDMDGAFNDLTLTLSRGADAEGLIDRLDALLAPYGGTGAYAREDQLSHRFLTEELKQQRTIATVFPLIFFGVAAFLLNVVASRLIGLEREQIGLLKAFGYTDAAVGLHYAKLMLAIVLVGIAGGIGLGILLGHGMSAIYMSFYSLPYMDFVLQPRVVAAAAGVSIVVALLGTLQAVRGAARLPPAEAMRPEPPAAYRATIVERLGLQRWFGQPTRMILRHIERRPLKSLLTMLGIAMACGIMMIGGFQRGAIDWMIDVQYGLSQRADLTATFTEPTSGDALYSLRSLPGVEHAEGFRSVPVRLRFGHRTYRTALDGVDPHGRLLRLLDTDLRPIQLPPAGVVLNAYLARLLGVRSGDRLLVEVLEGERRTLELPVAATAQQYLGVGAYMQRAALNRLLREGDALSGVHLGVDERERDAVYAALKGMPRIAGIVEQASAIRAFYDTLAQSVLFYTLIATLLGASIAFGVVYNSMRIALSERNRELASLRVLGFARGEVAYILLGELALLTLAAIPLGLAIGYGLCAFLARQFQSDLYRIALVLERDVYALAALVVVLSALVSGLLLWRNLGRLDMVAVLKSRE